MHDIPEPLPLRVVDHLAHVGICPQCKGYTKASFPEGIRSPVPYGPHLTGLVLDLNTHQLIPMKRLVETLRDLFGMTLSEGTVVNMVSRRASAYGDIVDKIRTGVVHDRVKHMDETGLRIGGRLQWLHVACTNLLMFLWIGKGRGDVMLEARGIVVHDCWKSYFAMPNVAGHGLCCAPILRELEGLFQCGREKWSRNLAWGSSLSSACQ